MTASEPADFECLPVAVRAWTVPATAPSAAAPGSDRLGPWKPTQRARRAPHRVLVFDCETTTDHSQRLLYGAWRRYVDKQGIASTCIEEGIFYADDLSERDPVGFSIVQAHARTKRASTAAGYAPRVRLLSRAEFVEQILWKWAHQQQATIVGFNLPFDLTRLATHCAPARGRNRGGISLRLWEHNGGENRFRPRIALRTIDGHRTLMAFTRHDDQAQYFRGQFVDVRTLAFAHTDARGLSLESACQRFGTDFVKADVEHGTISPEHIEYCRADVAATAALYRATTTEHALHPIELPAANTFSAATIGKGYWRAMGIAPTAERIPDLTPELAGWGMEAFYGGRAECRIRRTDMPVVYTDFRSMYMTCNALTDTWRLITAHSLTLQPYTTQAQELLDDPDLVGRCFDPATWRLLHTLVEVDPNGATLPVRARYDNASDTWGIGINPYRSTRPGWYPLADVLAARLLGGPSPKILRAFRLVGEGRLNDLKPTKLHGHLTIDPLRHDFFRAAVEQRNRAKHRTGLPPETAARLNQFLKVLANSTGFGILAQFARDRSLEPVDIDVYAGAGTPFTTRTSTPERPGGYCLPPLAATLTGAARLMLALLEHEVTAAGGTFAFCDTDSMAIVANRRGGTVRCEGGPTTDRNGWDAVQALSWPQVQAIVDRFEVLNPYDRDAVPGSILEIEDENFYPRTRRQRQLRCFAISAKRYQLTHHSQIVKRSEHGLGHLLNPTPDAAPGQWINEAWTWLTDPTQPGPDWLDLPALSRVTVSSPEMLAWFSTLNTGRAYSDQIKPGNFLLVAHPDPIDPAAVNGARPIAPYNRDPHAWLNLPWLDRTTGQPCTIHTRPLDGTERPGIRVRTYRDVLCRYLAHPEAKSLSPDGGPVRPDTRGLLQRRPVEAVQPVAFIGKEANDLDDRSSGIDDGAHTLTYNPDDHDWTQLILPVLRTLPAKVVAERSGVDLRTTQRALSERCMPRPPHQAALTRTAIAHAREAVGAKPSDNARVTLYRYLCHARE